MSTHDPISAPGGGLDMSTLLQQAQQMQRQLADAQARLAGTTVDGTASGGAVTVTVNGVGELIGVRISAGRFNGDDADDLTDLGDLIVASYRNAKTNADTLAGEALNPITGDLPGQLGF
jgi:DNA-binding protein YbaB